MSSQNTRRSANKARAILRQISETKPGTIRAAVADEALEFFTDNPRQMFKDLACHGCQSGMINMPDLLRRHTWFLRYPLRRN